MTPADVLADAFDRVRESALAVLEGLSADQLEHRPTPQANSIGWLVWHLARVQDDHVAGVADQAGGEQVYAGFVERFGLPYDEGDTGYGQTPTQVGAFEASAELLAEYVVAVDDRTHAYLRTIGPDDLDRVVDERWNPPVTLGVRLVSVVDDDAQYVGQAAYLRGLLGV